MAGGLAARPRIVIPGRSGGASTARRKPGDNRNPAAFGWLTLQIRPRVSPMKEAFIVMAILGCGDGAGPCETVRKVETPYESVADCRAASRAVLEKLTDLPYPVIAADCARSPKNAYAEARPIG